MVRAYRDRGSVDGIDELIVGHWLRGIQSEIGIENHINIQSVFLLYNLIHDKSRICASRNKNTAVLTDILC